MALVGDHRTMRKETWKKPEAKNCLTFQRKPKNQHLKKHVFHDVSNFAINYEPFLSFLDLLHKLRTKSPNGLQKVFKVRELF